ncbi:MAG: hypothetical protein RLZZ15_2432, partial [Verrucomicrobiota bacterium]
MPLPPADGLALVAHRMKPEEKLDRLAGRMAAVAGLVGFGPLAAAVLAGDPSGGAVGATAVQRIVVAGAVALVALAAWWRVGGRTTAATFLAGGVMVAVGWSFVRGAAELHHAAAATGAAALAVGALGRFERSGGRMVATGLATLVIAWAVAALVTTGVAETFRVSPPLPIGVATAVGLGLVGVGALLARPRTRLVGLAFASSAAGARARRLWSGAIFAPAGVGAVLVIARGRGAFGAEEGVVALGGALTFGGCLLALHAVGAVLLEKADREETEQSHQRLTARLQQQAAELQETVSRRTVELSEANEHLRAAGKTNALLALVAEHTTNGVCIADHRGHTEWINAALTGLCGYTLDDLKARDLCAVLPGPGSDSATVEKLRAARLAGTTARVELLVYSKDRHPFWVLLEAQPVRNRAGVVVNFIVFLVDITDERAAQQRLRSLNDRLALATRAAAIGVWEWDAVAGRGQWDARTLEIYGLAAAEYRGTHEDWTARIHPDDRERMATVVRGLTGGATEFEHAFRIVRARDGAVRHLDSRGVVQRDAAGRLLRVTGTDRDVTAEREAADAAATLNERLRLALRSLQFGVWELDVATGKIVWDERMHELYAIPRADFDGSRATWRERLHTDDRERVFGYAGKVISGEEAHYETAFRVVLPGGAIRHVEAHGYLQRDVFGRPLRLVGLNRDISRRRELEERVRKGEELAATVATVARIGGWEFDTASGRLTWTDGVRRIHEV